MPSTTEPEVTAEDRERAVKKAKAFIAHAVSPTANKNEARNAAMKACKLIDELGLLDEEKEGPSVLETIQKVQSVAADPEVRATVTAVGDTLRSGLDLLGKFSSIGRKR